MTLERFATFAEGLDHPEGIAWDPRGHVVAGGEAGQIYEVSLDGEVVVIANTGGFVLGLALDARSRIYACDQGRHQVLRIDPVSGEVSTYSSGAPQAGMRVPNYLAFAGDGTLYVTDSGGWGANDGTVFRVRPGGETQVWTGEPRRFPNGCCLTPEGDALIVVESTWPGVSRIPIRPDGSAGEPEPIAEVGVVPDGVAFSADGTLFVSCYRPDAIYWIASGRPELLVEDPAGTLIAAPTNIAFGGDDLKTLLVANLARWHLTKADLGIRGAPLRYPDVP